MNHKEFTKTDEPKDQRYSPPSVSLPKGGGAVKGIGEKFAANPVTGTGSLSIPLPLSPGRSGFTPALSLSYDSGAGSGPYGFGWSVGYPSITRRTDRGLPRYFDNEESDVFILSGAEDLVPVVNQDGSRFEEPRNGYRVTRYRPRIEGLFARIERWTNLNDPLDTFWRSISRENITTFYGKTAESRIADPADPARIFSWLICQSYDDKGNAIVYEYQQENSDGINQSEAHEKNRTPEGRKANRYLKRVKYGNRTPNRDAMTWDAIDPTQLPNETWMFEVVFDYSEGHYSELAPDAQERIFARAQIDPPAQGHWPVRQDPFSSYRAGFEVRTYRLCRRVLMFHHFPEELGTPDYLVRSTEFTYNSSPIASFITQVTQSGYVRQTDGTYLKKSLPPLSLEYSKPVINDEIETIDAESLENLPVGADGLQYQWLDLDGEGLQGVLSEQPEAWYYKHNLSPISIVKENGKEKVVARFEPLTEVATEPSITAGTVERHQFLDLAGDGNLDLVQFEKPTSGFFERTENQRWESFIPFGSGPNLPWSDPNLRFVDLTGDGHADILITEDSALTWYPSLAEDGFGTAIRVSATRDEEKGPAVVFADGTQTISVADLSGDGLTDIVRIRNGEICYWPNLGYGCFGAKVTMDNAPWFDAPDQFDQKRIRLADIDGSGTTDIIYLERNRVAIYRNECGNSWASAEYLESFPAVDDVSSVTAIDLLGIGTACLVWSSPLPGNAQRQMRYIDLMGRQKPHLLTHVTNNLGAETVVDYAPSTKFYLADKLAGKPWITRLPFPVHVVERVETRDLISRNRFVTRYTYHHGYFDGIEREFRGFGMVEQLDTEEFAALSESDTLPDAANIDPASHVPPVLTKTWFHTGSFIEGEQISRHFENEYYHEGDEREGVAGLSHEQLQAMLLPDTEVPTALKQLDGSSVPWNLTAEEVREACRALKGSILRQEVYARDGTTEEDRPYSASEQNYTIELLQPQGENNNAVFFAHPREAIEFHYERKFFDVGGRRVADPRVTHAMTLEVDAFGNVVRSVAIGYGRRYDEASASLTLPDREKQKSIFITYTENGFTNPIEESDEYRTPLPCESRAYELIEQPRLTPAGNQPDVTNLFRFDEMLSKTLSASDGQHDLAYENLKAEGAILNQPYRRLIEHVRTLYRNDDLAALLPLGQTNSLALPGESYKLAFTPGLLSSVYQRGTEDLFPDASTVLGSKGGDGGGYVRSNDLRADNLFPVTDVDNHWWIPSGRAFFSPDANVTNPATTASQELAQARGHFFLPRQFCDPFDQVSTINYDSNDLLVTRTTDALNNSAQATYEYRVLQPKLVTDPNGNRSEVAFDALGMVAGSAVMGKVTENLGDLLDASFEPDPLQTQLNDFIAKPSEASANVSESVATQIVRELLGNATTRIVYDLDRFQRTGEPAFAATFSRETHFREVEGDQSKIQISISYSDGFGREIQKKIQAEPGPTVEGSPDVNPRWVGSGWTIFNNKGKPVRQYEPFFSATHDFEFAKTSGVSPVLFYDPVGRVVATLHPNHTWEKIVFDPWRQEAWDVNDTALITDPGTDADVGDFFQRLTGAEYLPTWHAQREAGALGPEEQVAAARTAIHAGTPSVAYADSLERTFLTLVHNRFKHSDTPPADPPAEEFYSTRVVFDIEGNQREVIDAKERVVMRYDYDMLGNSIHQSSMEAGERWVLVNVAGNPIYAWDSRGHQFRNTYDALQRPDEASLHEGTAPPLLIGRTVYGESQSNPEAKNQRGKAVHLFDQAGVVTTEEYDFKGNALSSQRQLARDYEATLNWSTTVSLETDIYLSSTRFDALNRPISVTTPDNSVYRPTFNEANLLEKVEVNLRGDTVATPFVTNIDYDAKGQRVLIEYGNSVKTECAYDPLTFRLSSLKTTRLTDQARLQDLGYTYDPAGNITQIRDGAQQTFYFNNQVVTPSNDYTYDAIYRLINAEGREHIGQATQPQTTWDDQFRVRLPHPNDGQTMRRYTERYEYDAVGNFLQLVHRATNGNWTRDYAYNEPSLVEPTRQSNRLSSTTVGQTTESYTHDAHGNMTGMPHLTLMQWDFKDQLNATSRQAVNNGTPETTYYVYDVSGQRVRKVTERQNGSRKCERFYLGGFEVYREYDGNGTSVTLERETLHVMDDQQRIALVETRTQGSDGSPARLIRYQFGNHLGSASLELDEAGQIISYEEYYPYGSTSYQAGRSAAEVSLKRYRYTGMERDEETGFSYHSARYYASWLGRWVSCDPIGLVDTQNLYEYSRSNPILLSDPSGKQPPQRDDYEVIGISPDFGEAPGDVVAPSDVGDERPFDEMHPGVNPNAELLVVPEDYQQPKYPSPLPITLTAQVPLEEDYSKEPWWMKVPPPLALQISIEKALEGTGVELMMTYSSFYSIGTAVYKLAATGIKKLAMRQARSLAKREARNLVRDTAEEAFVEYRAKKAIKGPGDDIGRIVSGMAYFHAVAPEVNQASKASRGIPRWVLLNMAAEPSERDILKTMRDLVLAVRPEGRTAQALFKHGSAVLDIERRVGKGITRAFKVEQVLLQETGEIITMQQGSNAVREQLRTLQIQLDDIARVRRSQ